MGVAWVAGLELLLASGQAAQASLVGTVTDGETGSPLRGVEVALTDVDRTVATGTDGRYLIREVSAGPQHLAVRALGYEERTLHALVPSAGRLEINVSLRPQPLQLAAYRCVRSHSSWQR